jgi:carbonic anhydrase/acetyltransferase-like protein (isoleucine patch superfamily)
MLAAGTVVPERMTVRPRVLFAGVPGAEKKELSGSALAWTQTAADEYQEYRKRYLINIAPSVDARA